MYIVVWPYELMKFLWSEIGEKYLFGQKLLKAIQTNGYLAVYHLLSFDLLDSFACSLKSTWLFTINFKMALKNRTFLSLFDEFPGQPIDSPVNGPAPPPWTIPAQPPQMFSDFQTQIEVPHTANIKVCWMCMEETVKSISEPTGSRNTAWSDQEYCYHRLSPHPSPTINPSWCLENLPVLSYSLAKLSPSGWVSIWNAQRCTIIYASPILIIETHLGYWASAINNVHLCRP